MSFYSQGAATQGIQLVVQEVVVALGDQIVTTSASTITVDLGQPIASIRAAVFLDDSAATNLPVTFANQAIGTGSNTNLVTLTLSAAFAIHDSVRISFTLVN